MRECEILENYGLSLQDVQALTGTGAPIENPLKRYQRPFLVRGPGKETIHFRCMADAKRLYGWRSCGIIPALKNRTMYRGYWLYYEDDPLKNAPMRPMPAKHPGERKIVKIAQKGPGYQK